MKRVLVWQVRLGLYGLLLLSDSLLAETVKDREGAVRADAAQLADSDRWLYNDVPAGFAAAEESGKPLMVVLRCVPCLACMALDAEVLMENEELKPLLDQFVRVRVINANSLDLSLFQFDYDLSFSVLFLHPDKTILGRYGSWDHQKNPENDAVVGFREALQGALVLHQEIDRYRESLAGKTGPEAAYKTPVEMPALKGKYRSELDWNGQVVKSCVHCHQIGDAKRLQLRDRGEVLPLSLIAPFPSPETIGIRFFADAPLKIESVQVGSEAEKAGLKRGDHLRNFGGQPMISVADVSWVLDGTGETGVIPIEVQRGETRSSLSLRLSEGWRSQSDLSRRVGTWPMRAMAFGGMKLEELDGSRKSMLGLEEGEMALEAIHVGQYNKHAAAKRAGFQKGDIIVSVEGDRRSLSESELMMQILQHHLPGEQLSADVLRNEERIKLRIPIQ